MPRGAGVLVAALLWSAVPAPAAPPPIGEATPPADPSEEPEAAATTRLTVHVTDKDASGNNGIPKAVIELRGVDGKRRGAETDRRGRAVFEALPRGRVNVKVSLDNWEAGEKELELDTAKQTTEFELTRLRTELEVTVTGASAAIRDCEITVSWKGDKRRLRTDADGLAEIPKLPRGETVRVKATARRWETRIVPRLELSKPRQALEIELEKRHSDSE